MLAAIELDRESAFEAGEVEDVAGHPMLAAEFYSELRVAQALPKQRLCIGA